jgi:hypothetical protein
MRLHLFSRRRSFHQRTHRRLESEPDIARRRRGRQPADEVFVRRVRVKLNRGAAPFVGRRDQFKRHAGLAGARRPFEHNESPVSQELRNLASAIAAATSKYCYESPRSLLCAR